MRVPRVQRVYVGRVLAECVSVRAPPLPCCEVEQGGRGKGASVLWVGVCMLLLLLDLEVVRCR